MERIKADAGAILPKYLHVVEYSTAQRTGFRRRYFCREVVMLLPSRSHLEVSTDPRSRPNRSRAALSLKATIFEKVSDFLAMGFEEASVLNWRHLFDVRTARWLIGAGIRKCCGDGALA